MSPEVIRQIRMTAGLSQKAFAESIGVSQSVVGYYENRSRKISETIWPKITAVYHDVLEQLGIPEEMQEEPEKALVLSPRAAAIKQIRVASGLSQKAFAESLGFCKAVIGNCEAGLSKVGDRLWERVMEKYPDHAFCDKVDPTDEAKPCGELADHDDVRDHANEMPVEGDSRSSSNRPQAPRSRSIRSWPGSEKWILFTSAPITTPPTGSGAWKKEKPSYGHKGGNKTMIRASPKYAGS